jgi:hypothetical protein
MGEDYQAVDNAEELVRKVEVAAEEFQAKEAEKS